MSLKGRLNLFQTSMLRWRELHPYNAVHLIRVEQALDAARLKNAIEAQLTAFGLTGFVLDDARRRYEYTGQPGACVDLPVIHAAGNPLPVISHEIERQLNLPFPRTGRIDPFRFFAIDAGDSFHVGVGYDHFVGAGDSIVILLKGLWERYSASRSNVEAPKLELYPSRYRRMILRHPVRAIGGMRRLWELPANCRRSFRPRYRDVTDPKNGFACIRIERPDVERFTRTAKAWDVTQNDLVIAMLMQALSPFAEGRRGEPRRNELAIASIVNLRRDFEYTPSGAFGQFLSSFRVSHKVPPGIGLRQLAQDVRDETARVRRKRRYFQTLFAMQMTSPIWPFLSADRRANFHCKNYPVWAGTSPVNVDAIWKEAGGSAPAPEYVRGVSTGPLAPLVVAATTASNVMHVGVTYRQTAFSKEDMDKILTQLEQLFTNTRS